MRVIAGKARRLQLKTVPGLGTRPTTDRIKETLFNIINNDLYDTNFLDLFSGSGAIGIEALSRGAKKAYFVEKNRQAVMCIQDNLKTTRLTDDAVVMKQNVKTALEELNSRGVLFDIIFMDPPYNKLMEKDVLIFLAKSALIDKNSMIIVEADIETDFDYVKDLGFEILRDKQYKTNKHIFLKLIGD